MKTRPMINWLVFLLALTLTAAARAQFSFPGLPAKGNPNPGGAIDVIPVSPSPQVTPYAVDNELDDTTAVAGDVVVLADPTGGNGRSNWAGVAAYFDPADVGGSQGLPATEMVEYVSANSPAGFPNVTLLPNTVYVDESGGTLGSPDGSAEILLVDFGPDESNLNVGQEGLYILTLTNVVPEPGAVVALALGGALLGAGALSRRRRARTCPA